MASLLDSVYSRPSGYSEGVTVVCSLSFQVDLPSSPLFWWCPAEHPSVCLRGEGVVLVERGREGGCVGSPVVSSTRRASGKQVGGGRDPLDEDVSSGTLVVVDAEAAPG